MAFEDWTQRGGRDGLVELYEVVAGADVDSLDANLLVEDERKGNGIGVGWPEFAFLLTLCLTYFTLGVFRICLWLVRRVESSETCFAAHWR